MINLISRVRYQKVSGSAIIITMLTIAALMTISLGMATIVPRDYRDAIAFEASLTAEMNAWSGVEHGLFNIRDAQRRNDYFELAKNFNPSNPSTRPYGIYTPPGSGSNCLFDRTVCPALDRMLGQPMNQAPVFFEKNPTDPTQDVLKSFDSSYGLVVWHRRADVGNPSEPSFFDGLNRPDQRQSRSSANINPIMERDEIRRLDVRNVQGNMEIKFLPIDSNGCKVSDNDTKFWLVVTFLDKDNNIQDRKVIDTPPYVRSFILPNPSTTTTMSLRFLVTTLKEKERDVEDCFMRYNINTNGTDTADLGFDVVESTGKSLGVQRKLRVQVNRENGRPLNIFDFGIACQECVGIN